MINNELKKLIENKLAMIDIVNKAHEGNSNGRKFLNELHGIKQALAAMGITITYSINPYFFKDGEPSTYTIEIENPNE